MTINGIASTQPHNPSAESASSSPTSLGLEVSVQVLDMATSAFEDAASRLISEMASMTGVGQNVDVGA